MANKGRPKGTTGEYKEIKKNERIMFRVTTEQKTNILHKAKNANLSVSEYIISILFNK